MKLFILTRPPKDDIFDILPFIMGYAIKITVEEKIKNGIHVMKETHNEEELFQIVYKELIGFELSTVYLNKNIKKYISKDINENKSELENVAAFTRKQTTERKNALKPAGFPSFRKTSGSESNSSKMGPRTKRSGIMQTSRTFLNKNLN